MLQGLRDGNNIVASLNYIRRISDSIDLVLNYNARKSKGQNLINTASVQMRAIF